MTLSEEPLAKNEILFRSVNERLDDLSEAIPWEKSTDYLCECSDRGCIESIELGEGRVRARPLAPDRFLRPARTRTAHTREGHREARALPACREDRRRRVRDRVGPTLRRTRLCLTQTCLSTNRRLRQEVHLTRTSLARLSPRRWRSATAIGSGADEHRGASEDEVERIELLAEWHAERAPVDDEHLVACQAMVVVGIVLREVAEAIEAEWGGEADAC